MSCPTRADLQFRPQAVRRTDAIACIESAGDYRRAHMEGVRHVAGPRHFLHMARDALSCARRYDAEARRLGLRLPGGEPMPIPLLRAAA